MVEHDYEIFLKQSLPGDVPFQLFRAEFGNTLDGDNRRVRFLRHQSVHHFVKGGARFGDIGAMDNVKHGARV